MSEVIPEVPKVATPTPELTGEITARSISEHLRAVVRTGQWTLAMLEVLPTNELIRLGLFGGGEFYSRNPLVGAATIGLSTFAVEAVGGMAAAGLMNNDTDKGKTLSEAINKKSQSMHVPLINKDITIPQKLSRPAKIGWTLLGGTVIGMGLEQRENPNRTRAQNRLYSIYTSAWLGGAVAVPGFLAAEGIDIGFNNPAIGGGIAGGLIALGAAGRWAKKKFFNSKPAELALVSEEAL